MGTPSIGSKLAWRKKRTETLINTGEDIGPYPGKTTSTNKNKKQLKVNKK